MSRKESRELAAQTGSEMHSGHMTEVGASERYYWCLRHNRVETNGDACAGRYQLGPFDSAAAASHALERVRQRNEEWDADDGRWRGGRE